MNIGVVLLAYSLCWFFFKQKTAYEMRISDWSSDVCSSDLIFRPPVRRPPAPWGTAPAIHAAPRVSPPGESQARSLAPIPSFIAPPVLSCRFAGRLDGNPGGRFFILCPAHAVGVKIIMKINLFEDRNSKRLNYNHYCDNRMPSSA